MNKIYEQLNERYGGIYKNIRFSKLAFGKNNAIATVVCSDSDYTQFKSQEVELARRVSEICKFSMPVLVDVVKENLDPKDICEQVAAFARTFPYISLHGNTVTVSDGTVRIKMHDSMYALAKDDFLPRLTDYLENSYITKINVAVDKIEFRAEEQAPVVKEQPRKTSYSVSNVTPVLGASEACDGLIGAACGGTEIQSAAIVQGNNDDITVCGVLAMPTDFMSKGGGAKRSRRYEKFLLVDGEHTLQCRFFPNGEKSVMGSGLIGKTVCVFGNTQVERGRTGESTMTVRAIATCDIPDMAVIKARPEPREYATVKPEQYNEYVQASLFQGDDALPDALRGVFVAFDFETTGLSILYDKPTELGAVKIVDGVITETFHTMIDPQRHIPEEVSKKTGITDDMVKGQPLLENVLPDFYKFSYGCTLVGHNVAFDFPFLVKHGTKAGWSFIDRATVDTMGIAPRAIPGIDVLTLDNVLASLSLVNDNAHRALSDATATAKAFIAMIKRLASVS